MPGRLPTGSVTFVFTDVVGSTRLFAEHGQSYVDALSRLQRSIAASAHRFGGVVVKTEGDGAFLAFSEADAAMSCVLDLPTAAHATSGELDLPLRVGAHRGEAYPVDDDYISFAVHVAARVTAAAAPRQIMVTQEVIDALDVPIGERLGEFALRDVPDPVVLWRVAGSSAPPHASPARRTNVAEPHTSFLAREHETRQISDALSAARLVTLVGPGGVGKTRLASEYALANFVTVPGGVWLVELASVPADGAVLAEVASALGVRGDITLATVDAELSRRGEVVLVIDNCEHVLDETADLVAQLLDRCPSIRVLATSREPLGILGERVVRLRTLDVGEGELAAGSAERLFIARAAQVGADLSPADLPVVQTICRAVDGLPLALELTAARAADMPLEALAAAVTADAIALSRRGGHPRQRSLDSVVDWSLQALAPSELVSLLALSHLPARFDASVAEAILNHINGADRTATADLARRSLLDLDGDRYRMLWVVRRALQHRQDRDQHFTDVVHMALYRWALDHFDHGTKPLPDGDRDVYLLMEQMCTWAVPRRCPDIGRLLYRTVYWAWDYPVGPELSKLCEHVENDDRPEESADWVMLQTAALSRRLCVHAAGDFGLWTDERVNSLLEIARTVTSGEDLGDCLGTVGIYFSYREEYPVSEKVFSEVLALEGVSAGRRALAAGNLAVDLHLERRLDEAEAVYRAVLAEPEENMSLAHRVRTVCNLAELLLDRQDPDAALELLRPWLNRPERPLSASVLLSFFVEALITSRRSCPPQLISDALDRLEAVRAADPMALSYINRLKGVLADNAPAR